MIKPGDWVTTCYSGYWQVVDIKPKYVDETRNNEYAKYNKGDLIGTWVLMKKAFTPKMKFRLECNNCDGAWCEPVKPEIQVQIDQYFAEHPKDYEKFCNLPYTPRMSVGSTWVNLTDEEAERFEQTIQTLPETFTREEAMKIFEENGLKHCFGKPPANYIFHTWHTPWELTEEFDPIYRKPELMKCDN